MRTYVLIGGNTGTGGNLGNQNTAVGATALDATTGTAAANNTCVGFDSCGVMQTSASNVCIGQGACNVTTTAGGFNVAIGANAAGPTVNSLSGTLSIGYGAGATAANQAVLGGSTSGTALTDWYFGASRPTQTVANGLPSSVKLNATGASGTDIAGSDFIFAGGPGTGTGAGGDVILQTSPALATGTTLQTLETRSQIVAKQFTLVDATAATFLVMTLGNDSGGGGIISYCVSARDATNEQIECGELQFAGVDITAGAGGETCATPTEVGTVLQAVSAGTLATTWSATTGTDLCNIRLSADTSLTPTALYIKYSVTFNSGQAITPQ